MVFYSIFTLPFCFRNLATPSLATQQTQEKVKEKEKSSAAKESQSFVMNLFRGTLQASQVFPYPDALTEEQNETLKMYVDPVTKFFEVSIVNS